MQTPDPVTPLTRAEKAFVAHLEATSNRDEVLAELKSSVRTAIEIELATIPINALPLLFVEIISER